jgi:serine/threonine protein kinase
MSLNGPEDSAEAVWEFSEKITKLPSPGDDFEGYKILRQIGVGGMGVVYAVEQNDQELALKLLTSLGSRASERFRREALALAQVDRHPNIVSVRSFVPHETQPYLVMELVTGGTLEKELKNGPLGITEALEFMASVASAVSHIHNHDIIHRDLKPGNILIRNDSKIPLVTDFGLARPLDARTLTQSGEIVGTPFYMSPEQLSGDRDLMGPATDIWSLGVLLYEATSGSLPFKGRTMFELIVKIKEASFVKVCSANSSCPKDLDIIINTALQPKPDRRYKSAADFGADCRRLLEGQAVHGVDGDLSSRFGRELRQHMKALIVLGSVLLIVAMTFLSLSFLWQRQQRIRNYKDQIQDDLTVIKRSYIAQNKTLINHLAYHLLDCVHQPLSAPASCLKSEQMIEQWKQIRLHMARARGDETLMAAREELLSVKMKKQLNSQVTFLKCLHSEPAKWKALESLPSQHKTFLMAFNKLKSGDFAEANISFTKLSKRGNRFMRLGELGKTIVQLHNKEWDEAFNKLTRLSYMPELTSVIKPLLASCRQQRLLQALYSKRRDTKKLQRLLIECKDESGYKTIAEKMTYDFNHKIIQAKVNYDRLLTVCRRIRLLETAVHGFDGLEFSAQAHQLLADYARRHKKRAEAFFHYMQLRRLDPEFDMPAGFSPMDIAREAPSLFLRPNGLRELFDIVLEGGRAGIFLPLIYPDLLSTLYKDGVLDKTVSDAPFDPIARFWRGRVPIPKEILKIGHDIEDLPEAMKRAMADLSFVIDHSKTPDVFRAEAHFCRAQLWINRVFRKELKLELVRKRCREDLMAALKLPHPTPEKIWPHLLGFNMEAKNISSSSLENDLKQYEEAIQDRWLRTQEKRLNQGRPFGAGFIPMLPKDYSSALKRAVHFRLRIIDLFGQYEKGLSFVEKILRHNSQSQHGIRFKVLFLAKLRRFEQAQKVIEEKFKQGTTAWREHREIIMAIQKGAGQ